MFESIVDRSDPRRARLRRLLTASVGVHGVVIVGVLVVDQLRVPAVPEPAVAISFVDFTAAPPPPPPPPPKKRATPKKVEPKVEVPKPDQPKELLAPAEIPEKEPEPTNDDDLGSDEGAEDGVEGGVVGGVVGGVMSGALPPPPPPSPVFQDVDFVKKKRLQGTEPKYPPQALMSRIEGVVIVKITIGVDGRVQEMDFLQSHPAFERAVRTAIEGWVFQPHVIDGRAVPIYTIYRFVFKKG